MSWIKLNTGLLLNLDTVKAIYREGFLVCYDANDFSYKEFYDTERDADKRIEYLENLLIHPKTLPFNLNEQEGGK